MRPNKRVRFNGDAHDDGIVAKEDTAATSGENEGKLFARDVVELSLVTEGGHFPIDADSDAEVAGKSYIPKYLHQVFPKESIYGYASAKLSVYYDPLTLYTFVAERSQLPPRIPAQKQQQTEGAAPSAVKERTELIPSITKFIRGGLCETRASFIEKFSNRDQYAAPVSNLIRRYRIGDEGYGVFKESFAQNPQLVEFHSRIEFFMFVHIESASFIDHDDPRWEIYFVHRLDAEDKPREFVGYTTTYPFSAMRSGAAIDDAFEVRLRISQVLIMPHAQGRGHGSRLLHSIYEEAATQEVLEVTVEDPSEGFRALRDLTDVRRAYTQRILTYGKPYSETGPDEQCISILRKQLNMTKSQARRCLEVHALGCVDESDEVAFKKYRLWVKRRLHTDFLEILDHLGKQEMKAKLAELFDELVQEYRGVIERLEKRGIQLPTSFSQKTPALKS